MHRFQVNGRVQLPFIGLFLVSMRAKNPVLNAIQVFVALNGVALLALPAYLTGQQKTAWK